MKNSIQMVDEDQVENVGIMSGFMDDLEGLLEELSAEEMEGMKEGDEADMARTMERSPDSPEILMNNLRGDMRSIDARREELSDLVGFREAEETPEGVLALLQPILGQQAEPMMPPQGMPAMMPPQGMPPQGMPPMPPQGMPPMMPPQGMPPQQLAAGGPVGYADGGAPVSQLMGNIASQGPQADVQARAEAQAQADAQYRAARGIPAQGTSMPPQGTPVYDPNTGALIGMSYANDNLPAGFPTPPPMGARESMPILPDDAAIRDLLLQQGRQVAPPVAGPATGGIGSLAPPVAPVGGINDGAIMQRKQEEQQRRMMEEQQRRIMEERRPMPPYDPRMPMPPYDPRTGGIGTPIDDLSQLPPTDIEYDPRPQIGSDGFPVGPTPPVRLPYDPRPQIGSGGFPVGPTPPLRLPTDIGYDPTPPLRLPYDPRTGGIGTPVDQRPMFMPQGMQQGMPPPDSGVGALFAPTNAPRFMADGGMVQHFQDGSDAAGVTPSGTYSPEVIAEVIKRMQERMGQQPEAVPTLKAGMDEALPMYQELLGSDPSNTQAQMLFDIGQAALGYAGNVGPDGQPLRGSAAARLAGATRELPGRIGARAAGMAKEEQALRMAALQAAQGERSAAQARNAALYGEQSELYKDIATQEPAARMLTPEEVTVMGLDPERGAWGIDGKNKPFLAGGNTPVGPTFNLGDGGGLTPGQKKMDEAFAPINLEWLSGGGPDMGSQIASLAVVARQLEGGEVNLTGLDVGMLPDVVNYFINPMALDARDNVEAVVQRNLRLILGAQFTAKEGERLIARAYNPDLPEAQNASRVRRLLLQMTTAASQKQAMSDHFMKEGSLKGWTGAMPTIGDFEKAIDGAPGFTVNDIVGDSARGRSLLEGED